MKKKYMLAALAFGLSLSANVMAQLPFCASDTFSLIANSSLAISSNDIAVVGQKFYTIEAYYSPKKLIEFNVANGQSTIISNPPFTVGETSITSLNNDLYVFGGWTGSSASNIGRKYSINTNTWVNLANLPFSITQTSAVTLNGFIYITGGTLGNTTQYFFKYDPVSNTYTTLAVPNPMFSNSKLIIYNDNIYCLGGHNGGNSTVSNRLFVYNPSTNQWSSLASMPFARTKISAAVMGNYLYVFGGAILPAYNSKYEYFAYNFVNDSWSVSNETIPTSMLYGAAEVNDTIYIANYSSSYKYYCAIDCSTQTASITPQNNTSLCFGNSIVLNANTGTGLTYQWKNNGTNISGATAASYTANASGSYTVDVTNSNGCVKTSTATTVTVNPLTTPTFTQVSAICSGATLNTLPSTSNNSINGTWSPALNNTATTTYTFTPSSTASPTCATTTTMTITVNALPTATITAGGATTFCQGASVVLNANTGSGLTYQWKNNGTNIPGATAASYTTSTAGSYTVVVTNSNGCIKTSTATIVTVNPLTTPTFTQVPAICSGATLSALPTTSNNSIAGTWSPALNNTTTTTYTFTPNSSASPTCATSTTMAITVNALPTATIAAGGAITFCQGASVVLNANTGAGLTYQWKNNGTNISGATAASYTASTTGSYTVVVTNSNGCIKTSTATTVTVNPLTTPTFTQVPAICSGATLNALPTTSNNSIAGTWSPALNNTATTTYTFTPSSTASPTCATTTIMAITVNASTTPTFTQVPAICSGATLNALPTTSNNSIAGTWSPALNNTATTTYTFTPNSSASPTCATTTTMAITVNALPTATIAAGGATTFCQGASVVLNANTGAGLNYQWKNNGTNISGATAASYTASTAGSYTVVVTNSNGCIKTSTATIVTVNPLTTPTFTQVPAICSGATLNALPTTSNNSIAGTWSPALNNTTTTTYTFTPTSTASPTCATTTTMAITVNALPTSTITAGGATTFCQGASVVLNANTGSGLTYQWKNNGTNITGATTASYTASTSGSYTVIVANSNGCLKTSTATTVTVSALTTPTFTQVPAICSGATLNALPTTSNNSIVGTWSPAVSNTATTTYSFSPSSAAAPTCATTSTMTITVNALPTATITSGGATTFCQGDSVVLNVVSDNGTVYQWKESGNDINLATAVNYTAIASGSFTVFVTNSNNCSATSAATSVTVNPLTIPTFTQVPAICSGATLSALPTTSNNSIDGSWSPALNNTATTTYSFVPTSISSPICAIPATMTISVNPLPTATITTGGETTFCQGDSVIMNVVSDNGTVYQWKESGNDINLATAVNYTAITSGSYTVFVTNSNNCSATSTATSVTVNPLTTPTFTQVAAICSGATLSALPTTSNNSIAGSWSPELNNAATTTYSFVPSSSAFPICATPTTMSITVNPLPVVSLATFNQFCDTLGLVTLSGGAPSGGVYSGTSVSNNSFNTAIGSGTYPITYNFSDNNGCSSSATSNLTVIDCSGVGIDDITNESILLYPNPTSNTFFVETSSLLSGKLFKIFDVSGRILVEGNLNENSTEINVVNLSTGTYYFQVTDISKTIKLIKQ